MVTLVRDDKGQVTGRVHFGKASASGMATASAAGTVVKASAKDPEGH
jgi:acyl dehydratase